MMKYKVLNNVTGWVMFIISLTVYMLTLEPSVSLWDCGEFISAAYKLQVVHPPGAPFFLLLGRIFTMFAPDKEHVAFAVNTMSAVVSALTVLFTFWITTHFARKMLVKTGEPDISNSIMIIGSGAVAALALTFSDSFWFSAVEGEVYAMSSAFTALTFWAMLKWEDSTTGIEAEGNRNHGIKSRYADKWLVIIAYIIGLAIGTHLLNLLVIPAIVFIYYFKKFEVTRNGLIISFIMGLVVLFFVQTGIIPGVPSLMKSMDIFFVNDLGFGFGSGIIFTLLLIIGGITAGIIISKKKGMRNLNLAFICFAYIILGYSSYAMVMVRSLDNPPIDMNNPADPINMLSYINREQYGDRPLLYGPYFNIPQDGENFIQKEKGDIYTKDSTTYRITGKKYDYEYAPEYCTYFPRMGDYGKENGAAGYRYWSSGNMNDIQNTIDQLQNQLRQTKDPEQRQKIAEEIRENELIKPTMLENISFFFSYQIGHMYIRYFMWNFVGRQNDQQGSSYNRIVDGNWISGIGIIDNARLGPQGKMPDSMKNNLGKNKFYFLPLILGLLGLYFHYKRGKKDAIVTLILFIFTGILINVFLNQPPFEPRERDYSLVGSFQTFCIWVGLGVLFIADQLRKKMNLKTAGIIATVVSILAAPVLMAKDGWDDHDRSGRRLGIDFAIDYLESCAPNAILFTNGDNDTYPLWFAQNVEGIRPDIRIINYNLLPTDWYSQVLKDKVYDSEPLPLTLTKADLAAGKNEYMQVDNTGMDPNKFYTLRSVLKDMLDKGNGLIKTLNFKINITPEDKKKIIANGVVPITDTALIVNEINFKLQGGRLSKGELVLLDLIATNAERGWERPIYFTTTSGSESFANLEAYFQLEGLTYRFVPIKTEGASRGNVPRTADDILYKNLMEKFRFSNIKDKKNFYLDDKATLVPNVLQNLFTQMAMDYANKYEKAKFDIANDSTILRSSPAEAQQLKSTLEKDMEMYKTRGVALLKRSHEMLPENIVLTRGDTKLGMAQVYQSFGMLAEAEKELRDLMVTEKQNLVYFSQFIGSSKFTVYHKSLTQQSLQYLNGIVESARKWNMTKLATESEALFNKYDKAFKNELNYR
ncbi:MAG: DUF2723 domain-containing protein [Bacteroidia bacterium]|nr:DUF2723 domain-containing protein [Bacteroidia bacterium]